VKAKYDALLIVSFGGPEGMHEVMPFLENVIRGKNVSRERLLTVVEQYQFFDGTSPLNAQIRQFISALKQEFPNYNITLPVYWGNRNWHPFLSDAIKQMSLDGVKKALAFVTSGYSSYSSCRQYLENIEQAKQAAGDHAIQIDKLRAFYNHPEFIHANVDYLQLALSKLGLKEPSLASVIFTAHSIPSTMAEHCNYKAQLLEVSQLVAQATKLNNWHLVFQSRSHNNGWLGPDIQEHLQALSLSGVKDVVIVPIGFVCDHMEIIYDLDTQARNLCQTLGLNMIRSATISSHPAYIKMVCNLVQERLDETYPKLALGAHGPLPDICSDSCCPAVS